MIKMPENWNEVQEFTEREKLPVGAYVCKIKKAEVEGNTYGEQLVISYDICEGKYTDFYKKEYLANTFDNKKWKGVLRIWLPKEDGSDKDEMTKRTLKGFVTAVEKSNMGFKWNWDERTLVGRQIGVLYRDEEWEYDGKTGWNARPFRAISAQSVREEDYKIPKEKPLKNKESSGWGSSPNGYTMPEGGVKYAQDFAVLEDDDAQLPF